MQGSKKIWYAVYTKPRWEKKVYSLLGGKGIEAYCPLNRVRKKWSDRVKWVEEPLFKSYVFVKVAEEGKTDVRQVSGVINFIYWLGKPAVIKDSEIEAIRRFLHEYDDVQAVPLEIGVDTKVKIRQGAFMDQEATVVKVIHNKVQVVIESIGYSLVAVVDKSNIAMAKNRRLE